MKKQNATLIYALIFAALIAGITWMVVGPKGDPPPQQDFAACASGILMKEVQIKKDDAVKFGSLIADVMKPEGSGQSVDISSQRSMDLKTVLDKVPERSLELVLNACKDANHVVQGNAFFRGKITAVFEGTQREANGVRVMAVSDPGQQCVTNQGACSIALQSELLTREIPLSVEKPGYILSDGARTKLVSPHSLVQNGVELKLKPWPKLTVLVTRAHKPVRNATLRILGREPAGDELWPAGCIEMPGVEAAGSCPKVVTDEEGSAEFKALILPGSINLLVDGVQFENVPVEAGTATVELTPASTASTARCDEGSVLNAVKNELRTRRADAGTYAIRVEADGTITGTQVAGLRKIKPDERKLPCEGSVSLP